jgi:hypothetical protein
MHGLPNHTDLSFLNGRDLDGICFERGQLHFRFHAPLSNLKGTGICVRSKVIHHAKHGVVEWDCSRPLIGSCRLLLLLRTTIICAVGMLDGRLKLELSNGEVVTVPVGNQKKESYRIWDGETIIVV